MRLAAQPAPDVGRRALALWAALLWLLGFELLPNLHLGLHGSLDAHTHGHHVAHEHDAAHEHDVAHEHADDDHGHHVEHEHADDDDHADDDHADDDHADDDHADDDHREFAQVERPGVQDLDHGDHDLLHRGVAALQPPLAIPTIDDAPFVRLDHIRERHAQLGARVPTTLRARGPPAAAACRPVDCTT